ncbi:MAG: cytochrome c [Pseudomonadota bacterium]
MATASALALLWVAPGTLAERTIADAVYSKAQARAGKKLYDEHCIACHKRGYFREVLRTRRGETLDPLFEVMVTEMPQNDPGSLSDADYVDVIAYMLSQSRYAVGEQPLKATELGEITIPSGG